MATKRVNGRFVKEGGATVAEKKMAVRPKACRTYTRRRVAEALPEIIEKFVAEAKAGSCAHVKMLSTLSGLDKGDVAPKVAKRRKSVAGMLLEQLNKQ